MCWLRCEHKVSLDERLWRGCSHQWSLDDVYFEGETEVLVLVEGEGWWRRQSRPGYHGDQRRGCTISCGLLAPGRHPTSPLSPQLPHHSSRLLATPSDSPSPARQARSNDEAEGDKHRNRHPRPRCRNRIGSYLPQRHPSLRGQSVPRPPLGTPSYIPSPFPVSAPPPPRQDPHLQPSQIVTPAPARRQLPAPPQSR